MGRRANLDEAVDHIAAGIDDGIDYNDAVECAIDIYKEYDISREDILTKFKSTFLCDPAQYQLNNEEEARWMENNELEEIEETEPTELDETMANVHIVSDDEM